MLELQNISKYYHTANNVVMALRKVSLTMRLGEFIAITGESGSGKSTLLNVISGLDTYEDGTLRVNNKDISHYSVEELEDYRRQYIGFVFQDYNIIDSYTVYQNIEMALIVQGYNKEKRKERTIELIHQVGLEEQIHQKASLLSGGEKQRTVIARALAKDCAIIVCDEPTGNLDDTSAKNILALLHDISNEKLVIVVTHNIEQIKEFASRKIRLYDGEIVEDSIWNENELKQEFPIIPPYTSSFRDRLKLAWQNIKSVPKKTVFSFSILLFMVLSFIFGYGFMLQQKNQSYTNETNYFKNAFDGRVVITKRDETSFTTEEIDSIQSISPIRDITAHDLIYDSLYIHARFNREYNYTEFFKYHIKPAIMLNEFDVKHGRLPDNEFEVVISPTPYYEIGDYIGISNRDTIKLIEEITTNQFIYKIVGFTDEAIALDEPHSMYLYTDALAQHQYTANYEHAQVYLDIDGLRQYAIYNDIRIDNTLDDMDVLAYDMMFFDICRDFGYKEEVIDDFDAGLCPVEEFLPIHDFGLSVITRFENEPRYHDINLQSRPMTPHPFGQGIYMNKTTFETLFYDDVYQMTLIVYDMYEANQVKEELETSGYNVFYPAGVISEDDALKIIVRNLQLTVSFLAIVVAVYVVGYFVMRNVLGSKRRDYVIYRSIGTTKHTIQSIMMIELFLQTVFAFLIGVSILLTHEHMNTSIPHVMRYYSYFEYILIFSVIFGVMLFMAYNVNRHMFRHSVITSLKAE